MHKLKKDKKTHLIFQCTISKDMISSATDSKMQDIAKNVKMDGFRVGKAPIELINKKYQSQAKAEAIDSLINEEISSIIKANNLDLAISPSVDMNEIKEDSDIEFEVVISVKPSIKEIKYQSVKVDCPSVLVSQEMIDQEIQATQSRFATFEDSTDDSYQTQKGDKADINFFGTMDGVAFEGGSADHYKVDIGAGTMIKDFDDALFGRKKGEEFTIDVTFPEEYHVDLAGKQAQFKITVNSIMNKKLPEINDDLAKKSKYEDLNVMKEAIKSHIAKNYENQVATKLKEQVIEELANKVNIDISDDVVEFYAKNNKSEKEIDKKELKQSLLQMYIFEHIRDENKITVSEEEVERFFFFHYASQTGNYNINEIKKTMGDKKNAKMINNLRSHILEEKIYETIFSNIDKKPKSMSKDEIEKYLNSKA